MKLPDDVRRMCPALANTASGWLVKKAMATWPLEIPLGMPTEQAALEQVEGVRAWVESMAALARSRRAVLVPAPLEDTGRPAAARQTDAARPGELAQWAGENTRWERAQSRYNEFAAQWPAIGAAAAGFLKSSPITATPIIGVSWRCWNGSTFIRNPIFTHDKFRSPAPTASGWSRAKD